MKIFVILFLSFCLTGSLGHIVLYKEENVDLAKTSSPIESESDDMKHNEAIDEQENEVTGRISEPESEKHHSPHEQSVDSSKISAEKKWAFMFELALGKNPVAVSTPSSELLDENYVTAYEKFLEEWTMYVLENEYSPKFDRDYEFELASAKFSQDWNAHHIKTTTTTTTSPKETTTTADQLLLDANFYTAYKAFVQMWSENLEARRKEQGFNERVEFQLAYKEFFANWFNAQMDKQTTTHVISTTTGKLPTAEIQLTNEQLLAKWKATHNEKYQLEEKRRPRRSVFYFRWWHKMTRPQKVVIGIMIVLMILCASAVVIVLSCTVYKRYKMKQQMNSFLQETTCPVADVVKPKKEPSAFMINEKLDIV